MAAKHSGSSVAPRARWPEIVLKKQRQGRLLFVNKKQQKNFVMLGHGRCQRQCPWPKLTKIFAPLFLKSGHFLFAPLIQSRLLR
jgi:hypothetical protein